MTSKFLNISTDTNLGGDSPSDMTVPSQKAVKTHCDTKLPTNAQGLIMPNFDAMPVLATYEYDVSDTNWKQLFTRTNTETAQIDLQDVVYCRITVTGTSISSKCDCAFYWKGQLAPFQALVMSYPGNGDGNYCGIRYGRVTYPKALNNGYPWIFEFINRNNTARHFKIEVFKTNSKITWMTTATNTTYNGSYHNANQFTIDAQRGLCCNDTILYGYVGNANWANSINSYLNKYTTISAMPIPGEALLANQFTFMNGNKLYPATNKTLPIETGFGILLNVTAYNKDYVWVGWDRFRDRQKLTSLTNIPHATLSRGDNCYFRCTTDANGNIYSDNYVSNEMTAGYTWYYVGLAYSNSEISICTTGSHFLTLDSSGKLTAVDGKLIAGGGSPAWGSITGTLSNQTDLNSALNGKANDSDVVKLTGNQTIAGTKTFSSPIDATIYTTVTAGSTKDLVKASVGTNDVVRISAGGASNAGYVELATADDYNEPIYVRQYQGNFATLKRTATLLDGSGNTSFPGTVNANRVTANVLDGSLVAYQTHNGETGNLYRKLGKIVLTGAYQSAVVPFFYYKDAVNTTEVGYQGKISLRVDGTAGTLGTGNTGVVLSEYPDWINNGNVKFYVLYKNNTPESNQVTCEIWSYVKNAWDGCKIVPLNYHGYGRNYWTWYDNIAGVESLPEGYSQIEQKYGRMYTTAPSEDTTSSKQVDTVGARNTKLANYALDSNVVHKTGTEDIGGIKTFTNSYIQIKNNSISYTDTTKSQTGQNYINFWATDKQTGYINSYLQSSTQTSTNITAYFNDGTDTNQAKLTLYANKNGSKSGVLNFHPTEDTTSSVQIDTVGARNTKLANYVPTSRKVNNKALSSDITLTASDVGALPSSTVIPTVNNATLTIQKNSTNVATFTANASSNVTANISVPTKTSDLTNDDGFITGITSNDVSTALGYTPYNSSNPSGYQANVIETVKVNGTALTPSSKAVNVTVPTKVSQLTNDSGYTTNTGTVTSVNNVSPVNGNVTLSIPAAQVNSDWNATSGVAKILNKPETAQVHVVVDTYVNGRSWYRVYDDGWVEQGGRVSLNETSTKSVTYLKPFSDTNYCLLAIQTTQSTAGDSEVGIQFTPTSTTQGTLSCHYINPNTTDVSWYACGQGEVE